MKNARRGSVPDFCAVDAGSECRDGGTRGREQRFCIVCARGGEDAVVAGEGGTHADDVEEPGAERREGPGLKIVVNESLSILVAMLAEIGGKRVAVKEAARNRFLGR